MPDFLTRRHGMWHFVRRVPREFAEVDRRGIIKHSTKIKVRDDRTGRRAVRVAQRLNQELELLWQQSCGAGRTAELSRYDQARQHARSIGFDYIENDVLVAAPPEKRLERLEMLVVKGLTNDPTARAALLGTEKRPAFDLSRLFEEYQAVIGDEIKSLSPDQIRIWKNGRVRAVERFVGLIGDKSVTELTDGDALDYADWWRNRVVCGEANAKTANKDIGQLSRMLKDVSVRRRLNVPDIFKGLRLRGEIEKSRSPYDPSFIQTRFLDGSTLEGLNEDARLVLYVVTETGMRPSEVVNLQPTAIHLEAAIPYVKVQPDGRRLKTNDSEREIPLVGVALQAMKLRPKGFPRYRDKSSSLSGTLNKFLTENGLRPTRDHTVYSLRHSFKDRLVAAEAPDSLIDSLMGHKTYKPKYGKGPPLELKLKYLEQIAFTPPPQL
ncbi:MAG TPA: tyrosine-type recombinase/integrase [Stellaceae bacterium]|jgi:integrase|nr:tyrosine-type recombinase/integrase [Stellaceae bacterium]